MVYKIMVCLLLCMPYSMSSDRPPQQNFMRRCLCVSSERVADAGMFSALSAVIGFVGGAGLVFQENSSCACQAAGLSCLLCASCCSVCFFGANKILDAREEAEGRKEE